MFRRARAALRRPQQLEINEFIAKMSKAGRPGLTKVRLVNQRDVEASDADNDWAWGYRIAVDYVTFADEPGGETWSIPAWVLVGDPPSVVLFSTPTALHKDAAWVDKPVDPHLSLKESLERAYELALGEN